MLVPHESLKPSRQNLVSHADMLVLLLVICVVHWCRFPDPQHIAGQMVSFQDVDFNYPGGPQLFNKLDFGLDMESRLAMVGANGMPSGFTLCIMVMHKLIDLWGARDKAQITTEGKV